MSVLTKVFVTLLVVCSLLFTAATVVFVGKTEDFKGRIDKTEQQLKSEAKLRQAAQEALAASEQRALDNLKSANALVDAKNKDLATAQQATADKDVTIAQLKSEAGLRALDLNRLTEALKASEGQKAQQWAQVLELRKAVDDLSRKSLDLNSTVSDLTNKLDQTERERKYLSEQVAQFQAENARLTAAIKDLGGSVPEAKVVVGTKAGAPAINAIVRDVRAIAGGVPYATISVGSVDNVTRGMEFKVIDRDHGDFLGILTVDNVQPNEAVGRLTGPRVQDIKPGNEARTQL